MIPLHIKGVSLAPDIGGGIVGLHHDAGFIHGEEDLVLLIRVDFHPLCILRPRHRSGVHDTRYPLHAFHNELLEDRGRFFHFGNSLFRLRKVQLDLKLAHRGLVYFVQV